MLAIQLQKEVTLRRNLVSALQSRFSRLQGQMQAAILELIKILIHIVVQLNLPLPGRQSICIKEEVSLFSVVTCMLYSTFLGTEIIKSKHIPLKSKRSQKVDYHNLNQLNDVSSRTYINRKIDIIKEQIKKKDDSDTILK